MTHSTRSKATGRGYGTVGRIPRKKNWQRVRIAQNGAIVLLGILVSSAVVAGSLGFIITSTSPHDTPTFTSDQQ